LVVVVEAEAVVVEEEAEEEVEEEGSLLLLWRWRLLLDHIIYDGRVLFLLLFSSLFTCCSSAPDL
jgi:hypothetical protein